MAKISIDKAVDIALEQHRLGNFARAEGLYLEILRQDPGNTDAIHLLGVLATQGKNPEAAVQLISAAIRKEPNSPVFHYNLAEALHVLDRKDEAVAAYQRAVDLAPDYFEAQNNLANILNELRRYAEAEATCRRAIELKPDASAPFNNLGNALRGLRRGGDALDAYRTALKNRPDAPDIMNNLAMCLCWMNHMEQGIEMFHKALHLDPAVADVHNNLGAALMQMGRWEEAGQSFHMAIELKPNHAEANNNLGAALRSLNRPFDAIHLFKKAIEIRPEFVEAQTNLAAALSEMGRKTEALEAVDAALVIKPRAPQLHCLRGNVLRDLQRYDEAIESTRQTLRIDPNYVPALTGLGHALLERGELDEAMASLKRSIELNPDPQTHSNVLMGINYHPGYSPKDLLDAHKSWAELHEKPHMARWTPHENERSADRRLRIGYVSPDFRSHSVSYFLEAILENHNHKQFEIFAYAHLSSTDMSTWKLRSQIDQWREIAAKQTDKVAESIRNDRIDILVELAGHTANNAMPVFARKPAPVQINMIGFPSTTGLSSMDYRITDERCDPAGVTDLFNTETLIRMPDIFWCYSPPPKSPEVGALPAESGTITFTSVNNFTKVTPDVQRIWAKVLVAVPNSRLIIQTNAVASENTQGIVKSRFQQAGVSPDRLEFRKPTDLETYLRLLERSDMTFDPFPFNGGTTTCHSLWMGAPVITLAGDRHASRMGLSMLTCIGLPEFVAHTPEQYVDIARTFANDLPRLRDIRAGMRERLKLSPLLDGKTYTQNLEAAYRQVWRKWCASGPLLTQ